MPKREELAAVVGAQNVLDQPEVLEKYSQDQSLVRSCRSVNDFGAYPDTGRMLKRTPA